MYRHATQQAAFVVAFDQAAADKLKRHQLEGARKSWGKELAQDQKEPDWSYVRSAHQPMTLAQLLIRLAILCSVSIVFFGIRCGYYDINAYNGNGTAH